MEQEVSDFLDRLQIPPKKMSVKELREREETWRALWSWIPEEVKYYVLRAGTMVRIMRSDYKGTLGELGNVKFTMHEMDVITYEKIWNPTNGQYYYEQKIVRIPGNRVLLQEFILDSESAEEVDKPEVMGLEATEDETLHNILSQ